MIFNHGLSVENPKVTSRKSLTQNDLASIVVGTPAQNLKIKNKTTSVEVTHFRNEMVYLKWQVICKLFTFFFQSSETISKAKYDITFCTIFFQFSNTMCQGIGG